MTDPTSPQAIAARLTPRQREALMWLPADGSERTESCASWSKQSFNNDLWQLRRFEIARDILAHLAEVDSRRETDWRLTPLGRRVREEVARGTEMGNG